MDYKSIRDEWIHLRKISKDDRLPIDKVKQVTLELIIDKVLKFAKVDKTEDYDKYVIKSIKSELKQALDAHEQGVENQDTIDILKALLPSELSEEEMTGTIIAIIAKYSEPKMQDIMKDLKTIEGMNMKFASGYVRSIL